jgi:hypothetical protein
VPRRSSSGDSCRYCSDDFWRAFTWAALGLSATLTNLTLRFAFYRRGIHSRKRHDPPERSRGRFTSTELPNQQEEPPRVGLAVGEADPLEGLSQHQRQRIIVQALQVLVAQALGGLPPGFILPPPQGKVGALLLTTPNTTNCSRAPPNSHDTPPETIQKGGP